MESTRASGSDQPLDATVAVIDLPVRFAETDAMGIVHHSNYLVWFEAGRIAWMAAAGMPYSEIAAGGHHFAVTSVNVAYRTPARFGESVRVATRLTGCAAARSPSPTRCAEPATTRSWRAAFRSISVWTCKAGRPRFRTR